MSKAEIIATIPFDVPAEVVAREMGTGAGYVRQIRRHGVAAMRESSRRHGVRYREMNRMEIRAMQRDWTREKRLLVSGKVAWETQAREQDKAFISHMMTFEDRTYKDIGK